MTKFTSYIIYRKEWALKWFILLAILFGLLFISNWYLESRSLSILFFALLVGNFFFIKLMMKYFTRKAIIELDDTKISFNVLTLKDNTKETFEDFSFFDLNSYNVQFPTSRFACLTLKLNSGSKKEFSFLTGHMNDSQTDTNKMIESIHTSFKKFNIEHKQVKTIEFQPSFYASKKGLYTIASLVLLSIITIALAINFDKNLPATFAGTILIIGSLIIRRSTDLNYYNKMTAD